MSRVAAMPFVAGVVAGTLCWIAAGVSLGLFFGGIAMLVLSLPPLLARNERPVDGLLTSFGVVGGIACVWLVTLGHDSLGAWIQSCLVLAAVAFAVVGFVLALRRAIGSAGAAAVTTIMFIAWLAWPIWLSPWLTPRMATLFSPIHPLFASNRVFIDLGVWTQQPLMYQLTVLGQDVPYELPGSIVPCVLAHAIMGLAMGLPGWWWSGREALTARPPEASPAS